jgi:hypothetical protein
VANPYDGLFGDVTGGAESSAPTNPYAGLWVDPEEARRRKRAELAAAWGAAAHGQSEGLGRVPVPDTSLSAVATEAVGMAGASLAENAASVPQQAEQVLALPGNALRRRAGLTSQRLATEGGAYGQFKGAVDQVYAGQLERLAVASQDLPGPLAASVYLGAEMAGQAAEPTTLAAGGILRTPRGGERLPLNAAAETGWTPRAEPAMPPEEVAYLARRAEALRSTPGASEVPLRPGAVADAMQPEQSILQVGEHPDDLSQAVALGLRARPQEAANAAELSRLSLDIHPETSVPFQESGLQVSRGAPESFGPRVGAVENVEPRPGEAGFVRNPWAPRSDLYRQTYQIRHDFVTDQAAAVRESAVRSSALQAAIPSKAVREDMTAVFHGTGNPLVKGDTADVAAARLAASPHAAEAQAAIDAWRQRSDELFQMAKDSGADELGYFKDYLHMVYEPPAGEKAIRGSSFSEGPTTSVMRERHFENPAQAMAMGYTPRSLDFSVLMHETERAHAHTRAILGLMDDIGEVNDLAAQRALRFGPMRPEDMPPSPIVRAAVNPDPKAYVRVEGFPILDRAAPGRVDPEAVQMAKKLQAEAGQANRAVAAQRFQPALPGLEDLGPRPVEAPGIPETPPNIYVHRDLWRNLQPVLEHDDPNALDKALSVVKRINFLGSLFHGASLTEAAMDTLGPIRGLKEGAKRGFGIPGISQVAARLGGGKVAEDAVQEAIRAGVNVEPPRLDMMKGTFEGLLNQWEGSLRTGGGSPLAPRNVLAKTLSAFRGTAAMYDEALWKNYHAPLKVTAYHVLLDRVRTNPSRAVARALETGALSQEELAQSVARHVNSAFGGQNWELLQNDLLSNPKAVRWARRVMLSPDWNYSAIDTGLSPLSADPVRRQLGATYYKNAVKLLVGWNALNYALSGHAMWNNETGHKWDLETGMHDDKGRKLFYQVSKHAGETPDFLLGRDRPGENSLPVVGSVPNFMLRKANSPLVGAYTAMSGTSPTGFPGVLERARDEADRQARPLSGAEVSAARLRDLTSGVLPFVAQEPESMARKMMIPFVEKKGMSLHDGRILFAEALRRNDDRGVQQIRQWLVDNGYDGEAINRALSGAYSGIRAEQKANGPAAPPPGPPQPTNPYAGLWR